MARPRSAPSPLWASRQSPHPPSFVGPCRSCPPRCPPGPLSEIEGVFVLKILPPPMCGEVLLFSGSDTNVHIQREGMDWMTWRWRRKRATVAVAMTRRGGDS
jgi:hypothetical protein